jgi:Rho-binding antiterminator
MTAVPDYSPMDCAQYSRLELAILRRHALRLRWVWRGITHLELVQPVDLRTRRHAEYLILRDALARRRILRLDRIRRFDVLETEPG